MNRIRLILIFVFLPLVVFTKTKIENFQQAGPIITLANPGVVITFFTDIKVIGSNELCDSKNVCKTLSSKLGKKHEFYFKDIVPGNTYKYRLGNGYSSTKWFQFIAPKRDKNDLSFIVLGDVQIQNKSSIAKAIVLQILQDHMDVDLIISPGDLAADDKKKKWKVFFKHLRKVLASKPFMPVPGNHDTPFPVNFPLIKSFRYYFASKDGIIKDGHYRFKFGPASFIGLNTERQGEFKEGKKQYKFIKDSLLSKSLWNFAFYHVGSINYGVRHYWEQYNTRVAAALFNNSIDWVFSGHEHFYQRSHPVHIINRKATRKRSYNEGVGYLLVPPFAKKSYGDLISNEESKKVLAFPELSNPKGGNGFIRVDIKGSKIHIRTYYLNSSNLLELVDEVKYEKAAN